MRASLAGRWGLQTGIVARIGTAPTDAEVAYGDRAEHCWNGDPTRPNALSRLRYHQMFIPRIMAEMRRGPLPPGADTVSWRY